jgi:multidrug efflux pump subunit AcrB
MTVTIAVVVSMVVSLTLTPMMCSRFLHHHEGGHHLLYRIIEKFFTGLIGGYRRTLDIALHFRFITLMVFFATMGLSVYLFITSPKGFFPPQDTGVIIGTTEGAQDISYKRMYALQRKLVDVIAQDPDTAAYASNVGTGISGQNRAEAMGSAQGRLGTGIHRPQSGEAGQRRGRPVLHAGDPRRPRRRPHFQDRIPVHAAGCGL